MTLDADLVLEGGGTKGVALIGAVARLQEKYSIHRVAGTSVGALVAAFVAAGYSGDELEEELLALPFESVPQAGPLDQVCILGPLLSWSVSRGVYSTQFIRDYLAGKLEKRNVATFGQLRETDDDSSMLADHRYRLVVTVTDVTTGELLYLPWDYPKLGLDPDEQSVADAVAASLAIPLFFEPRHLVDGSGKTHVLVDGGLLSNFPITVFDRTDGRAPRWPTFGVKIIPKLPEDLSGLSPWLGAVLGKVPHPGLRHTEAILATAIVGRDQTALSRPCVGSRVFTIDTSSVGLVDFDMSKADKLGAFEDGRAAAQAFLDGWNWTRYRAECRPEANVGEPELLRAL